MRLRICLVPADGRDKVLLPFDFRRHFISLLKQLYEGSEVAERFALERPGFSPYAFAVGFRRIASWDSDGEMFEIVPPVRMVISTGIPSVLTAAANGALRLYDRPVVLGLKIASLSVLPLRRLQGDTAVFRIAGHAVLRGKDCYLDPLASTPAELEEAINTHMLKRLDFLGPDYLPPGRISPVSVVPELSSLRKGVCSHYGGMLTTVQGRIALKGSPASLQFLYDFGIGVRTGQGFGMLDRA